MIRVLTVMMAALLPVATSGAECTLENARYNQPDSGWTLQFNPVPVDSAPNQIAAFELDMPASRLTLVGGIFVPNGFGSPLYRVDGPCSQSSGATCGFVEDDAVAVYTNGSDGIEMLDVAEGRAGSAPQQILLPKLAAGMWYSMYRETEFADQLNPTDVFTLVGCD